MQVPLPGLGLPNEVDQSGIVESVRLKSDARSMPISNRHFELSIAPPRRRRWCHRQKAAPRRTWDLWDPPISAMAPKTAGHMRTRKRISEHITQIWKEQLLLHHWRLIFSHHCNYNFSKSGKHLQQTKPENLRPSAQWENPCYSTWPQLMEKKCQSSLQVGTFTALRSAGKTRRKHFCLQNVGHESTTKNKTIWTSLQKFLGFYALNR